MECGFGKDAEHRRGGERGPFCVPVKEVWATFREEPEAWRKRNCGGGEEGRHSTHKLGGANLCGMVTVVTRAGITGVP